MLLLVACGKDTPKENLSITEDFKQVDVGDQYSVKIPKYMKRTTSLNSEASFQCNNVLKTAYCIIIDEDKKEFVDSFRLLEQYNEDLSVLDNWITVSK